MVSREKRTYRSAVREDGARVTRARVVDAAGARFVADGYAAASVEAIARDAGVSVQTVYNAVGRKPALLKAAYDVMLAGDDEPIAINDRPQILALKAATGPREALRHYAGLAALLTRRVGRLVEMLLAGAAAGDPDLRDLAATINDERLIGATGVVTHLDETFGLRPGLARDDAIDVLWTLTAPEVERRLVGQRGWSARRFETWLGDTMADLLLGPA